MTTALQLPGNNRPTEFSLPDATRLGIIRLQVARLERSVEWYERVLGFRTLSRDTGAAALGAHDGNEALVELREQPAARPAPRRGVLGLYHFAILLPDRTALGRLITHLATVGERAGASNHLVSEALYLTDPDGLGIEIYADLPRSAWQRQGGELQMATAPLDLESVVAASGGQPWAGMPHGTTIGHVHLHVGDIDQATRLYHEALGFDIMVRSYPGARFLSAGGYHHHLGINTWAGPGATAPGDRDARLLEWTIVLPNDDSIRQVAKHVSARGYAVRDDGNSVVISDFWGTSVRLLPETVE